MKLSATVQLLCEQFVSSSQNVPTVLSNRTSPTTERGESAIITPATERQMNYVLLSKLKQPSELTTAIKDAQAGHHLSQSQRQDIADELTLRYFYGGNDAACIETTDGLAVIVSGDTSFVRSVLDMQPREIRTKAIIKYPDPLELDLPMRSSRIREKSSHNILSR